MATLDDQARLLRNIVLCAGMMLAGLQAQPGAAQTRFEEHEVSLLPAYCRSNGLVAQNPNPAEAQVWRTRLGEPYKSIHHYCWAQLWTNRARIFAKNRQERTRALNASIPEFDYILRYTPPDYVLLPEILTKRGENLLQLGRAVDATRDLQAAIKAKPDYWPPYAALSDYYKAAGDNGKAREWLEKGLAGAPDAKALQSRMSELGGAGKSGTPSPKPAARAPGPQKEAGESAASRAEPEGSPNR